MNVDYKSLLFQVLVWWPEGGGGDGVASELTAEGVRRFVGEAIPRMVCPGSAVEAALRSQRKDGTEFVAVFKEGNVPVAPPVDVSSGSDVSELTQRCKLGRIVVDCEQLLEVRTFPGYLDVRVKPGVAISLVEVVERKCFEFRAVGEKASSKSCDADGGSAEFESSAGIGSEITFPTHDMAWEHVKKMASDPVLIGLGFVLRRNDDKWKPSFITAADKAKQVDC